MAIDYLVQYPCEVRSKITDEQLLGMIKSEGRAHTIIRMVQKDKPDQDVQSIINTLKIGIAVRGPNGTVEQKDVTIASLLEQAAPLNELAHHCRNCPANFGGTRFGCIGAINYPISRAAEEWLLDRLPSDAKDPKLLLLLDFLRSVGLDGKALDAQRARDDLYEAKQPLARKWGGLFSKTKINSSQILQMLFLIGNYDLAICTTVSSLLNFSEGPGALPRIGKAAQDSSVSQIHSYMMAMAFAVKSQSQMLIDA